MKYFLRAYVTLDVGAGHGRHEGDPSDVHDNRGSDAAVSVGSALRLPTSGKVALAINASPLKDVGGESDF